MYAYPLNAFQHLNEVCNGGLVSPGFFAEAKQEFDGSCSVQVYSVQTCIPKDLAVLWNPEFVQAEELFKQPSTIDNCLRDNRYICCLDLLTSGHTVFLSILQYLEFNQT